MIKYAVISSFLSKTKDRFHEYNEALDLEAKFKMASEIPNMDAMECVYPYEVSDPAQVKQLMKKYQPGQFQPVNVKCQSRSRSSATGGLTSPVKAVRDKAVRFIKEAKDFAIAIGADKVTCCPLGDGWEFNFQTDYSKNWGYLKETFSEAAAYRPEITLYIEYKPSETRGHLLYQQCRQDNPSH